MRLLSGAPASDPVVVMVPSLLDARPALATTGQCWFEMHESHDLDSALRVALIGELDIAAADALSRRLRELNEAACPVRLDLSHLYFMDCGGLDAIVIALIDARHVGWQLLVDSRVSRDVERLIHFANAADILWPLEDVDRSNLLAPFGSARWSPLRRTRSRPAPL